MASDFLSPPWEPGEKTRFSFTFDPALSEVLGLTELRDLPGQALDVSWGDRRAKGTIERAVLVGKDVVVTMVIDAPLELDGQAGE